MKSDFAEAAEKSTFFSSLSKWTFYFLYFALFNIALATSFDIFDKDFHDCELLSIFEFDEYYKYINEKQDLILRILIMYKEHQDILDEDLCKMELSKKIISKILVIYKCFNYIDFSGEKNIRKKINLIINDTSEVEEILYYAIKLKRVLNFIDDEEYQNFDKNIQSALNNVYLPSHIVVKGDALLEWGYDKANVKGILNEVLYKIIKGDLKNNYTDIKNYVINNF